MLICPFAALFPSAEYKEQHPLSIRKLCGDVDQRVWLLFSLMPITLMLLCSLLYGVPLSDDIQQDKKTNKKTKLSGTQKEGWRTSKSLSVTVIHKSSWLAPSESLLFLASSCSMERHKTLKKIKLSESAAATSMCVPVGEWFNGWICFCSQILYGNCLKLKFHISARL